MSSAPSAQSMNHSSAAFPPLFSHHCLMCWADHLIHPTSLSGDPGNVRSLGTVPYNLNCQVSGRLQEELWLGVGKEWYLCCNSNSSFWALSYGIQLCRRLELLGSHSSDFSLEWQVANTWISRVLQILVTFRVACQSHGASSPNFLLPRSRYREINLKQTRDRSSSSHNLGVLLLVPQQRGSKTRIFSKKILLFSSVCVVEQLVRLLHYLGNRFISTPPSTAFPSGDQHKDISVQQFSLPGPQWGHKCSK